ncbi:Disease resistance protein RPP4 [Cardamine amara subsp. amara]|uniref:Disease resistance protein RPP4 n=1 Tax=Cardamine amara subsp. amara TaxID=228776 RepID=A0ABD0ZKR5_CARAN
MVGIVGTSGIGKSTIGQFLFSKLSSQFHHHALVTYNRPSGHDSSTRLRWEEEFLRKILGQKNIMVKNIMVKNLGEVEKRLKHKKVLIVLDDVGHQEFLQTLVGKTELFGLGSRIIVITQDRGINSQEA